MGIVTISHDMGSGGSVLGTALAERLGYRYVDQAMISHAAREYGVGANRLAHFAEAKPSFLERFDVETRHYITVLESAVLDVAEGDDAIIMGRSGQVLLRSIRHVLRVFVMAPFDLRVQRVAERLAALSPVDTRVVADLVRRTDQEKSGRMRYLFDVDRREPNLYDLVVNTEKVPVAAAVDAVAGLARRTEAASTEASRQAVRHLACAARVRVALAAHPGTRKLSITVEADHGVVRLQGTTALDEAARIAGSVSGVERVETRFLDLPRVPPFAA
jgi:cytidylate kinase